VLCQGNQKEQIDIKEQHLNFGFSKIICAYSVPDHYLKTVELNQRQSHQGKGKRSTVLPFG
jgi:hypothetical protein